MILFPAHLLFPSLFLPDKNGSKNLGKFVSPPTKEKGHIQLSYSDGDDCGNNKKITTNITLVCKPGTVTEEEACAHSPSSLQWGGREGGGSAEHPQFWSLLMGIKLIRFQPRNGETICSPQGIVLKFSRGVVSLCMTSCSLGLREDKGVEC